MTATPIRIRFRSVIFGNMLTALAMHCSRVVSMRRRIAGAMSITHERPELEPVIARDFTPALAGLMERDNIVKTLARSVR